MKPKVFAMPVLQLILLLGAASQAQPHQVNLSSSNATPNNCGARTITATVTGGSGNYTYFWSAVPPTGVNLGNSPSISVSPTATTVFTSAVQDNNNGEFATASITIGKILSGSFSVSIPNSFTPNGDGINDTWDVMDGSNSTGPLNAYRYDLSIHNTSNQVVFNRSETLTTGTEGITGGYVSWNGRINGTGSIVPNGFYTYALLLYNCSGNQQYSGTIVVLGVSSLEEQLILYPNPASDYVEVLYTEAENSQTFEIMIRSNEGIPVMAQSSSAPVTRLDVQSLEGGLYYLSLQTSKEVHTARLIIDR